MPRAQRERRERTDNYHLLIQCCRTPEQRLYEQMLNGKLCLRDLLQCGGPLVFRHEYAHESISGGVP